MIEMQRRLAVIGRVLLLASRYRPAWIAGTATLSMAKILENMEIGHNVLHGQWDWMNDPHINSSTWDWDTASTAEAWKHSHNYVHHTFTNIRGKDKDLGYEIMRIDPHQKWHPVYLFQPLYNLLLAAFFEWGVAFHDLDFEAIRTGKKSKAQVKRELAGIRQKAKSQVVKDYVAWPLISGLAMAALDAAIEARRPARAAQAQRRVGRRASRGASRRGRHVPLDRVRERHRQRGPQRLVLRDHLLRPLPRPDLHLQPSRRSRTSRRGAGTCASSPARPTSRAARSSTSPAATSATRSSTTSSRTCPAPATRRSPRRSRRSATATASPTTAARSGSSWEWCSGRSCGSLSREGSPGQSPVRTNRKSAPHCDVAHKRPGRRERAATMAP